ncbi:MAG: phosphoheptose isomerase [Ignavibacteria bacterium GWF2_33_9]|nr:MAG: phosphoheptose isomerase [Ignavibacteria bacterium GWF2_33_9]
MNVKDKIKENIQQSANTKMALLTEEIIEQIVSMAEMMTDSIRKGGKILFCGNGGSAADSQHLAAELVVRLRSSFERPPIPAIALTVDTSILTAGGNDYGFDYVFSRQVEALARPEDILIAISTSGNSKNIMFAIDAAKTIGTKVIGFSGGNGGKMVKSCDALFIAPSNVTARIQEVHILIGHILCEIIEEKLYS